MIVLAFTPRGGQGEINLLVFLAVVGLVCLVVSVLRWPTGPCRRCHGSGKERSPTGKFWRDCPACAGGGTRVRGGRRVLGWMFGRRDER